LIEQRTERLLLRQWRDADLEPFAVLNADPEVMRYFPASLARDESDDLAERIRASIEADGWGLWAVEVVGGAPFTGFVGLNRPRFEAHFMPAVEVGWRLAREHWGRGYATEAAVAALSFGFERLDLDEVVAMTTPDNVRSQRVMERLDMTRDPADDFVHPVGMQHVLYRLSRGAWCESRH
jgi:RimJ/RimL family protein N-acetyltransferase